MAAITVYHFTYYNPQQDSHEKADGLCTEETISRIGGATIIRSLPKQIDDSQLTQSGRYYEPHECITKT